MTSEDFDLIRFGEQHTCSQVECQAALHPCQAIERGQQREGWLGIGWAALHLLHKALRYHQAAHSTHHSMLPFGKESLAGGPLSVAGHSWQDAQSTFSLREAWERKHTKGSAYAT
jgi:hypothetical protein